MESKTYNLLLILFLLWSVESEILENATCDLISEVHRDRAFRANIFSFSEKFDMNFLLDNLWNREELSVKFSTHNQKMLNQRKMRFAVMIFDSEKSYLERLNLFNLSAQYVHGLFIIVFTGDVKVNKTLVFEKMWLKSFYNVGLLSQTGNRVDLSTFYPFHESYCNKTPPTCVNEYVNYSWTGETFFPNKFQNFFKCPIKIAASDSPSKFFEVKHKNGVTEYAGSDWKIIDALADTFNFQAQVNYSSKPNDFGDVFENGTSYGLIEQIVNGTSDVVVGLFLDRIRVRFMDVSETYLDYPIAVLVPSGAPYTSLENLFRPFSVLVWISFSVLLICVLVFIRFRKTKLRYIVGEKKKYNYYLIIMETIVGDSIKHLPKTNFPRILIMSFFIYCLVMRTVYESKMFHFFQSGENMKTLKTLNDMEQRNMKLYVSSNVYDMMSEFIKYPKE